MGAQISSGVKEPTNIINENNQNYENSDLMVPKYVKEAIFNDLITFFETFLFILGHLGIIIALLVCFKHFICCIRRNKERKRRAYVTLNIGLPLHAVSAQRNEDYRSDLAERVLNEVSKFQTDQTDYSKNYEEK